MTAPSLPSTRGRQGRNARSRTGRREKALSQGREAGSPAFAPESAGGGQQTRRMPLDTPNTPEQQPPPASTLFLVLLARREEPSHRNDAATEADNVDRQPPPPPSRDVSFLLNSPRSLSILLRCFRLFSCPTAHPCPIARPPGGRRVPEDRRRRTQMGKSSGRLGRVYGADEPFPRRRLPFGPTELRRRTSSSERAKMSATEPNDEAGCTRRRSSTS